MTNKGLPYGCFIETVLEYYETTYFIIHLRGLYRIWKKDSSGVNPLTFRRNGYICGYRSDSLFEIKMMLFNLLPM